LQVIIATSRIHKGWLVGNVACTQRQRCCASVSIGVSAGIISRIKRRCDVGIVLNNAIINIEPVI
jgi:hypothetical protein